MIRILTLALCAIAVASANAEEVVIRAAKVYTQTGPPLAPGAVRIKDGKIAEVAGAITAPSGVRVIDLGNGVLMPGLIDAFTSIGLDGSNSESTREVTPSLHVIDAVDWSSHALKNANAEGTTTLGVVPGSDNVFAGLGSVIKSGGPSADRVVRRDHALVITAAGDPSSGNSSRNRPDSIYNRQPTNRMGVVWMLRNEFGRAAAGSTQSNTLQEALAGKLPVFCVSRIDADILTALRLNRDNPVKLTIAGGQESYKVRDELAAAKVPVFLSRVSTVPTTSGADGETIFNTAGLLNERGIPFAFTGGKLLDQACFAVRHGLSKDAALAAMTSEPARLLGISDRVGSIAVGRDADLVALTGEPFELTSAIRWTMTGGVTRPEEQ